MSPSNVCFQQLKNMQQEYSSIDELGPYTVLCGRSSTAFNHVGNRRFRLTINLNLQRYMDAPTKKSKSEVIKSIVKYLLEEVGARFVKQQKSNYVEVSRQAVKEKVAHSLRDLALHATRQHKSKATIKSTQNFSDVFETPISQSKAPSPDANRSQGECSCDETPTKELIPEACLSKESCRLENIFTEAILISDNQVSLSSPDYKSDSELTAEEEAEYNELVLDCVDDNSRTEYSEQWEEDIERVLRL